MTRSVRELRAEMAAAAASVIPFHCIICFDEFNTSTRPPMVLPCGHTYVCLPCTKRLKRCMECRESLFVPEQTIRNYCTSTNTTNNSRFSTQFPSQFSSPATPTKSPIPNAASKIPLPICKNVVLLAMMEATQRISDKYMTNLESSPQGVNPTTDLPLDVSAITLDPQEQPAPPTPPLVVTQPSPSSKAVETPHTQDDEEDAFDADRLVAGLTSFAGPCGTYAVRDDGLVVLPQDPRKTKPRQPSDERKPEDRPHLTSSNSFPDEVKDELEPPSLSRSTATPPCLVRHHPPQPRQEDKEDEKLLEVDGPAMRAPVPCREPQDLPSQPQEEEPLILVDPLSPPTLSHSASTTRDPYLLEYGQKVQVVTFEDGVATLARHEGFILATHQQLVKVGRPLEESCRLQGLLETVRHERHEIRQKLAHHQKMEDALQQRIDTALSHVPTHPVISEPPPPPPEPLSSADQAEQQSPLTHPTTPLNALIQPSLHTAPASEPLHGMRHHYASATAGHHHHNTTNTTPTGEYLPCPAIPDSPVSIDNADLDLTRSMETTQSHDQVALTYGCGTNFDFLTSDFLRGGVVPEPGLFMHGLMTESLDDHDSARMRPATAARLESSAAAAAQQHQHQRTPVTQPRPQLQNSYSFSGHSPGGGGGGNGYTTVNFRSGLSGHYGLSTSGMKKGFGSVLRQTASSSSSDNRPFLRMRGDHRGTTSTRRSRPKFA